MENLKIVAVLSTVVVPPEADGVYRVETLESVEEMPPEGVDGVPHYIGHPDTKNIVEGMGAIKAPSPLFQGLSVGETAVCFPIKPGRSNRSQGGTAINQSVTVEDLDIRLLTRIE